MSLNVEIVAYYAAFLSTAVFVWEIYKHHTKGAKLRVNIGLNQVIIPAAPGEDGILWVSVTIVNIGDTPTTLTGISCKLYTNWVKSLQNKAHLAFVFPNIKFANTLPTLLNPGEKWCGLVPQKCENNGIDLLRSARDEIAMMEVDASHLKKAATHRLRAPKQK